MTCRIVIVDDAPQIRAMLLQLFEDVEDATVVGEAADARAGVALVEEHSPDVVVLDLAMPGIDGLKAIPLIKAASPQTKIAVLSLAGRSMHADAYEAGADAYLGKQEPLENLVRIVLDLSRR